MSAVGAVTSTANVSLASPARALPAGSLMPEPAECSVSV
jgi:hypothetical protein